MLKFYAPLVLACFFVADLSANSLNDAQRLFQQGKPNLAISQVNEYLKDKPKSAEGRFLKGLILVEQGDTKEAVRVFTGLTREYPELPEPYNNIAVIHAANGDYDNARAALQAALKTHPSYATAYENLGDIYAKMASEAYQQALNLDKQGSGKLKVKLSLIGNLFGEESRPIIVAAQPVEKQPVLVATAPKPKVTTIRPVTSKPSPVSEPVKPAASPNQGKLIIRTIQSWAAAWSAQDVNSYLSYYANTFRPAKGTATTWRKQRHARLNKPEYIDVSLSKIKLLNVTNSTARIELVQLYRSNTYKDSSRKRFDLILTDGQWKINREIGI